MLEIWFRTHLLKIYKPRSNQKLNKMLLGLLKAYPLLYMMPVRTKRFPNSLYSQNSLRRRRSIRESKSCQRPAKNKTYCLCNSRIGLLSNRVYSIKSHLIIMVQSIIWNITFRIININCKKATASTTRWKMYPYCQNLKKQCKIVHHY